MERHVKGASYPLLFWSATLLALRVKCGGGQNASTVNVQYYFVRLYALLLYTQYNAVPTMTTAQDLSSQATFSVLRARRRNVDGSQGNHWPNERRRSSATAPYPRELGRLVGAERLAERGLDLLRVVLLDCRPEQLDCPGRKPPF